MTELPPTRPRARQSRGLFVVILLALIFFALIGALLFLPSRDREPRAAETELFVIPAQLRLRTAPSGKAAVLGSVKREERLILLEDQGAWVRVESRGGLSGWTERSLLEAAAEHERRTSRTASIRRLPPLNGIVDKKTPIYSGPGMFYPVSGELVQGSRVKVYTRDHDFFAVEANGEIAYVDVDAVNVTASEGSPRFEVAAADRDPAQATRADDEPEPLERPSVTGPEREPELPFPGTDEPEPPRPSDRAESARGGVYAAVPPGGVSPQVINRVVPDFPRSARAMGADGAVVIRGIVRKDGRIDDVEIIKDQPYGLGESARRAVRRWQFRPASLNGQVIEVYWTITVNFKLAG
ncbi:MAG TPA: TonB family protein [Thermoanaerobaculia bacterium]|nr:TonB family protein [Thermoanaerobaculia bacterium]